MENPNNFRGAGGTPGGVGEFVLGLGLVIAGGYMFTRNVTVMSGYWYIGEYNAFGLALFPLLIGIGLLFFDARSLIARLFIFGGMVIIVTGIIANLNIYFQPTSLFNTVLMLGMLAAGIGLVARSLRSH
ncbi:MAG: hypothetical protein SF339_07650 [Blastocatellia bacterium]|nr:hypothetical protein [Blastocatellia bacterium]